MDAPSSSTSSCVSSGTLPAAELIASNTNLLTEILVCLPAAELIASNIDLLTEILVCLPATSLIRFKSVSKHWLSLISDSRFAVRHAARNPRPSALGLFLSLNAVPAKPTYVSLQGHPNPPSLAFLDGVVGGAKCLPKIVHSSNGLLLCEYISHGVLSESYLVCNPTTRSYKKLLPGRLIPYASRAFLSFDPSKSPHYYVVVMHLHNLVQINVYFSESSSWKQFHLPDGLVSHARCQASCNGILYWISKENVILSYEIDSERMLELPTPPEIDPMDRIWYVGECSGRLTLIQRITHGLTLIILEMDKDRGCWRWIAKFQVNLGPLLFVFPNLQSTTYSILCVVEGKKEKDFEIVFAFQREVMSYNLKSDTWNVLHDEPFSYSHSYATYPFVASLSPL